MGCKATLGSRMRWSHRGRSNYEDLSFEGFEGATPSRFQTFSPLTDRVTADFQQLAI